VEAIVTDNDPVDTAWRIHSAIIDWTGKVDAKASFVLAIESAIMIAVIGLTGDNRRLSHLEGWAFLAFAIGVGALTAGLGCVAWVVRPRLRKSNVAAEAVTNYIYFGHARLWKPDDLEQRLIDNDILPSIARQIVWMSDLAWDKHLFLQRSMLAGFAGTTLIGLAAALHG
jgi:hypothetical protein